MYIRAMPRRLLLDKGLLALRALAPRTCGGTTRAVNMYTIMVEIIAVLSLLRLGKNVRSFIYKSP
jgi:hypothetical protein